MLAIQFKSKKLARQFNSEKELLKAFGTKRAKRLAIVMSSLRAAPNMGVFAPPYSPPHRCHELTGNRKGKLSLDLDGPYRLIIEPANDPVPRRDDGGLDWHAVTAIRIPVLKPSNNLRSVAARMFRTSRARAGIVALRQASATPCWAFWLPPEGRAHKRSSAYVPVLAKGDGH